MFKLHLSPPSTRIVQRQPPCNLTYHVLLHPLSAALPRYTVAYLSWKKKGEREAEKENCFLSTIASAPDRKMTNKRRLLAREQTKSEPNFLLSFSIGQLEFSRFECTIEINNNFLSRIIEGRKSNNFSRMSCKLFGLGLFKG